MFTQRDSLLSFDERIKIERTTGIGILMIFLGVTVIAIATLGTTANSLINYLLSPYVSPWIFTTSSNLGSGLLAAGILTITLERVSRKRHQLDIEELKTAHSESILKTLMPEKIYEEVKSIVIKNPFLRRDFTTILRLSWKDESHQYLYKKQTIFYEVENISGTLAKYEVAVIEEQIDKENTKIEEIKIKFPDTGQTNQYSGEELEKYIEVRDDLLEARITIDIEPAQKAQISLEVRSVLRANDVYNFSILNSTIGLQLNLAHPTDLHPRATYQLGRGSLPLEVNDIDYKCWRINKGILPYSRIAMSWRPLPVQNGNGSDNKDG